MISVIIPMYNAESTIVRALESVRNQQTDEKFEIIIINDGSTDGSSNRVQEYITKNPQLNIVVLTQENKGVSAARNAGLRIAKGEFIALLDADDEWLPEKTERQLQILKNKSFDIDFIACAGKGKKLLWPYLPDENGLAEITFRKLLIRNEIPVPSVMFKRKVIDNSGVFDETQRYAEDLNFWYKVAQNNRMFILEDELIIAGDGKRTFGVSGLSANLREMEKGFQKGLKDLYASGALSFPEFILYRLYFRIKYYIRLLRSKWYSKNS